MVDNSLPNIDEEQFQLSTFEQIQPVALPHAPRILLLYGSLRKRSFSRLVVEECARLLSRMGAEVEIFNPEGLPQTDTEDENHPKVQELRRTDDVVRGAGVVFAGTAWLHDQHFQKSDRLGALKCGQRAPHSGQNPGGDAGMRWFAVV